MARLSRARPGAGGRVQHRTRRIENLAGFQRLLVPFVSLPSTTSRPGTTASFGLPWKARERLSGNDLTIASIALAHDCLLVTRQYTGCLTDLAKPFARLRNCHQISSCFPSHDRKGVVLPQNG